MWCHSQRRPDLKYLDLQIIQFSWILFWVTGTVKPRLKCLRLPRKRVWYVRGLLWKLVGNFGSRNYFKFDLLRLWCLSLLDILIVICDVSPRHVVCPLDILILICFYLSQSLCTFQWASSSVSAFLWSYVHHWNRGECSSLKHIETNGDAHPHPHLFLCFSESMYISMSILICFCVSQECMYIIETDKDAHPLRNIEIDGDAHPHLFLCFSKSMYIFNV